MNLTDFLLNRHATKGFDPSRKIPEETMDQLRMALRYSPSSVNLQPWHYVIASTDEGKARIAESTACPQFDYNGPKIRNASHVVVFCSRVALGDDHVQAITDQEAADGRLSTPESKARQYTGRMVYVDIHRFDRKDAVHWMEKQVYLSIGTLLLSASILGVDACPMEGLDPIKLDELLDLRKRGLSSVALVALGYSGEGDFNAFLPKSRFSAKDIFTEI